MPIPRQPQGIPHGGQFSAAHHGEPAVSLSSPVRSWRDENPDLFTVTVRAAAHQLRIQPLAVEKDYWVCRTLRAINEHAHGKVVFKGGTSLEKQRIIQRFSEDLDLPMKESPAGVVIADPGAILIELGQTGGPRPSRSFEVTSLLGRQLAAAEQDTAGFEDLSPFSMEMLHPGRTLIEKLLRVNSFALDESRRINDDGWSRIGRQFYDIWALLREESVQTLLADRQVATEVMADCMEVSKTAPRPDLPPPAGGFALSLVFDPNWEYSSRLRDEHRRAMAGLYYGAEPPPSFDDVLSAVDNARDRLGF